jgi:uncharacterized protein YcfL
MMKKLLVAIVVGLMLMGCSTQSGFWENDSIYQTWDHLKFSWFGHRSPTAEDIQNAKEQGWWGVDVPYVPGQ